MEHVILSQLFLYRVIGLGTRIMFNIVRDQNSGETVLLGLGVSNF